MKLVKGGNSL